MKERLAIGCAMVGNPKLLILDEPTNGLDPEGIIDLRNLLKHLAHDKKMTIFLSSHQLSEIQNTCDRVAFLKNGKIITTESVDDILKMDGTLEEKYISLMNKEG